MLILGHRDDAHAAHIYNTLTQAGVEVHYWDTRLFPTQLRMSWSPEAGRGLLRLPHGQLIDLQNVSSVFWRTLSGTQVPQLLDETIYRVAVNDTDSALRSLLQADSTRWVNSWQAYQFHREKPLQLAKIHQLGIPIPATLIGNDPEQVIAFVEAHPNAIFKPVYGGAHTQRVTRQHLEPDRLDKVLSLAPVTIQEYIEGTNVRCYVVGNTVYGAEIRSPAIDFREDAEAELLPIKLPEAIEHQCRQVARSLYLEWTAIDWRVTPAGDFIFLEANPSPMFLYFEQKTKFPITQNLVQLLTAE